VVTSRPRMAMAPRIADRPYLHPHLRPLARLASGPQETSCRRGRRASEPRLRNRRWSAPVQRKPANWKKHSDQHRSVALLALPTGRAAPNNSPPLTLRDRAKSQMTLRTGPRSPSLHSLRTSVSTRRDAIRTRHCPHKSMGSPHSKPSRRRNHNPNNRRSPAHYHRQVSLLDTLPPPQSLETLSLTPSSAGKPSRRTGRA
jgi:hypothetical protein